MGFPSLVRLFSKPPQHFPLVLPIIVQVMRMSEDKEYLLRMDFTYQDDFIVNLKLKLKSEFLKLDISIKFDHGSDHNIRCTTLDGSIDSSSKAMLSL
jgi:hypothetical protein